MLLVTKKNKSENQRLFRPAAPPPLRFARRRLRQICRSLGFEHVVPSALVLKRRIHDVTASSEGGHARSECEIEREPGGRVFMRVSRFGVQGLRFALGQGARVYDAL